MDNKNIIYYQNQEATTAKGDRISIIRNESSYQLSHMKFTKILDLICTF